MELADRIHSKFSINLCFNVDIFETCILLNSLECLGIDVVEVPVETATL